MKVILKKRVKNLGEAGDLVEVSSGFFMNFLAPQSLAVKASSGNLKWAEKMRSDRVARREEIIKNAREFADKISQSKLVFEMKVAEGGKLFGAVSEKDISEKLKNDLKISLDKKQIRLKKHLKEIGNFSVEIHLADEISTDLKIEIVAAKWFAGP